MSYLAFFTICSSTQLLMTTTSSEHHQLVRWKAFWPPRWSCQSLIRTFCTVRISKDPPPVSLHPAAVFTKVQRFLKGLCKVLDTFNLRCKRTLISPELFRRILIRKLQALAMTPFVFVSRIQGTTRWAAQNERNFHTEILVDSAINIASTRYERRLL